MGGHWVQQASPVVPYSYRSSYVDGRRLGGRWEDKLVTGQDTAPIPKWPYGRFRWCGVVTYGAELRFSGPEIPYGWPSDRPHPSYLVPHGIFRR